MAATVEKRSDQREEGQSETIPSLSASVLLIAPLQKRTLDGFDYRVLLLKRNSVSSTFTSASVFPGGNLDAGDKLEEWKELFEGEPIPSIIELCAVRETFEESGILLVEGGDSSAWKSVKEEERLVWRDKVHSNGKAFIDLFKFLSQSGQKVRPALSSLVYRANWITPKPMKRRFDTHFYTSILPPSFNLEFDLSGATSKTIGSADGKETVSADWLTPSEAIAMTLVNTQELETGSSTNKKSIILFPPQFYLLAELSNVKSWKDLLQAKVSNDGHPLVKSRKVQAFIPEMAAVHDSTGALRAATVLPGDPKHSSASSLNLSQQSLHRTYVLVPEKPTEQEKNDVNWKKKTPLGLTVQGLERRGMDELLGEGWEDMNNGNVGKLENKSKL